MILSRKRKAGIGCVLAVEHVFSMCQALGSTPAPTKEKGRDKILQRMGENICKCHKKGVSMQTIKEYLKNSTIKSHII